MINNPNIKERALHQFSVLEWLILLCCLLMFAGFLFSRITLSVGMIGIILLGFRPGSLKAGWEKFRHNTYGWLAFAFFLAYLISGFWSGDMDNWRLFTQIKIPFALLPFAMMNLPFHRKRLQLWLTGCIMVVLLAGIIYSCSILLTNPERLFSGRHLPSPAFGDYIRFTIAIVLTMQMVLYLWKKKNGFTFSTLGKTLMVVWFAVGIIYLHLQAAKSGLLCFYLFVFINVGFRFFKNSKYGLWKGGGIIVFAGILLFASTKFVPPVKSQFAKLERERELWNNKDTAQYGSVSSVIPRLMSYETAWKGIQKHPIKGVGAGDLNLVMNQLYEEYYPYVIKRFRVIPHNQYICSALLVGIPLTLLLVLMIIWPFFKVDNIMLFSTTCMMVVGTLIEAMFEIQYGVFVYLFFTLFWLSALQKKKEKSSPVGASMA